MKKIALLSSATILLLLLALEIAARMLLPHDLLECNARGMFDPYAGYKTRINYRCQEAYANNLAFRRKYDTTIEKPPGTMRIILAGGSAAWGLGSLYLDLEPRYPVIAWNETIDFYLEKLLHERFPGTHFEVLNGSAIGYWAHHHLLRYITFYQSLAPDLIVTMDGQNDYFRFENDFSQFYHHPYLENFSFPVTRPSLPAAFFVLSKRLGGHSALFDWVAQSYFTQMFGQLVASKTPQPQEPDFSNPEEKARFVHDYERLFRKETRAIYDKLGSLCSLDGCRLVVGYQPILALRERAAVTDREKALFDRSVRGIGGEQSRERMLLQYQLSNGALEKGSGKLYQYVNIHEVTKSYRGQMFTDYCHLTPEGGKAVAEALLENMSPVVAEVLHRRRADTPSK